MLAFFPPIDRSRPTTTCVRTAILRAADSIEREPHRYLFSSGCIPDSMPNCPSGCALGWIGHHLEQPHDLPGALWNFCSAAAIVMGYPMTLDPAIAERFYRRMDSVTGLQGDEDMPSVNWYDDARECARGLRLYADRYHPAPRVGIPSWVGAIFTRPASEEVSHV